MNGAWVLSKPTVRYLFHSLYACLLAGKLVILQFLIYVSYHIIMLTARTRVASIRISNGSPLVYYDHYTKLHIVARTRAAFYIYILWVLLNSAPTTNSMVPVDGRV